MQISNSSEIKLMKKIGKVIFWIASFLGPIGIMFLAAIALVVGIVSNDEANQGNINSSLNGVPSEYIESFNYAAQVSGIPNWVLAAVTKHESDFKMDAVSTAGAWGLMQFRRFENSGADNWDYYLKNGMDQWFKDADYTYSDINEAWDIYKKDSKMQVLTGAFVLMEKGNYALKKEGLVDTLEPFNLENMKLFPWNADDSDTVLRNSLRRMFVMYNYGQGAGADVDLDEADSNYPNRVYATAMGFRNNGLDGGFINADGVVGRAIQLGKTYINNSTYVYGGGRLQYDIDRHVFDCSSFVHHIYKQAGLELGPVGSATTYTLINKGAAISFEEMVPGDLVFFNAEGEYNSHMGVYIGNNSFIHCAINRGVVINEFNSYWRPAFLQATRVVN